MTINTLAAGSTAVVNAAPVTSPWKVMGVWQANTEYVVAPQASFVSYNGQGYVCIAAHTSGVSFDATKWAIAIDIQSALQSMVASLPTTLPVASGQLWINQAGGGVLCVS